MRIIRLLNFCHGTKKRRPHLGHRGPRRLQNGPGTHRGGGGATATKCSTTGPESGVFHGRAAYDGASAHAIREPAQPQLDGGPTKGAASVFSGVPRPIYPRWWHPMARNHRLILRFVYIFLPAECLPGPEFLARGTRPYPSAAVCRSRRWVWLVFGVLVPARSPQKQARSVPLGRSLLFIRSKDIDGARGQQSHRRERDGGLHHHGHLRPAGEHRGVRRRKGRAAVECQE